MTTVDEFRDAYNNYREAMISRDAYLESPEYDEDNDESLDDSIAMEEYTTLMKELLEEDEDAILKEYGNSESMIMFIETLK
jgi:hypothetical protein